jgi:aspartate carbamoyltransferase catalytic subunit
MTAGLAEVDIVMMLRLQSERMHGAFVPSTREYFHFFGLDYDKLRAAKPDALIMHPGPMNRGVEIGSEIADDIDRSLIRQQVEGQLMGRQFMPITNYRSPRWGRQSFALALRVFRNLHE